MRRVVPFASALLLAGCSGMYYAAMEKVGKEKRDILASRIAEGKKDQEKAREQFKTTLEAFQALTGFDGGDLEKTYKKLNNKFENAEARAKDVREQIASIEKVSQDLFKEWGAEIGTMSNGQMQLESRNMLRDTQRRQAALMDKMRDSERRMQPVLKIFRDQVLFLKHNLNARAIRSLKNTAVQLDTQVTSLVKDIDVSIAEADAFIASLSKKQPGE